MPKGAARRRSGSSLSPSVLLWVALGVALGSVCVLAASPAQASPQAFDVIERGRYIAVAADCAACHNDPVSNQPFSGGRPIDTPFGKVIAPNITPDRETGIGAWSDEQFIAALKEGQMPDHRRLYPAMPFPYYTQMTSEDVRALRAYLDTVPAVHHPVEPNILPFPFNIRAMMRVWDALYFDEGDFKPNPTKSAAWNRGAYLVEALGHCEGCHTAKNFLGGDKKDLAYRGYVIQGWSAPDITNAKATGLAAWAPDDIVAYLQTGHNRFAAASGPMAEEVHFSSSRMSKADLEAMAFYLKDLPGVVHGALTPLSPDEPAMQAGRVIYEDACSACHRQDGAGVPYLFPDLAGSTSVAAEDPATLVRVVLSGAQSVATDREPTGASMPSFGWQLSDAQVAAVTTYVRNTWGHAAPAVTEHEVKAARHAIDLGKNPG